MKRKNKVVARLRLLTPPSPFLSHSHPLHYNNNSEFLIHHSILPFSTQVELSHPVNNTNNHCNDINSNNINDNIIDDNNENKSNKEKRKRRKAKYNKRYFKKRENQHKYMEELFYKELNFTSLDQWCLVTNNRIKKLNGTSLLSLYSHHLPSLLSSLYPHFPWIWSFSHFDTDNNYNHNNNNNNNINNENIKKYNKGGEEGMGVKEQRRMMEKLYIKYGLKGVEEWMKFPLSKLLRTKEGKFLLSLYSNNFKQLLQTIYPNYHFPSPPSLPLFLSSSSPIGRSEDDWKMIRKTDYFADLDNQRDWLKKFEIEFGISSLDDWADISKRKICLQGGRSLIKHHYAGDMMKMLSLLYPSPPSHLHPHFLSLSYQQKKMEKIFFHLKFSSFDDLSLLTPSLLSSFSSGRKLLSIYDNHLPSLLSSLFPNYPWPLYPPSLSSTSSSSSSSSPLSTSSDDRFHHLIVRQRRKQRASDAKISILDFNDRKIRRKDEEMKDNDKDKENRKDKRKRKRKGPTLILPRLIPSKSPSVFDLSKVDRDRYPLLDDRYLKERSITGEERRDNQYQEVIEKKMMRLSKIERQQRKMEKIYRNLRLNGLEDWVRVKKSHFFKHGGFPLLLLHSLSFKLLLTHVYPHYPWSSLFYSLSTKHHLKLISTLPLITLDEQREVMDVLAKEVGVKEMDDWLSISRRSFSLSPLTRRLLSLYHFHLPSLLTSLYPHHHWKFDRMKYKPIADHKHSHLLYQLLSLIKRYGIRRKEDWYRVPLTVGHLSLLPILSLFYPNERWLPSHFLIRTKKSTQRHLFLCLLHLFPSLLII